MALALDCSKAALLTSSNMHMRQRLSTFAHLRGHGPHVQVPDGVAGRPARRDGLEVCKRAPRIAQRHGRLRLHHAQRVAVGPAQAIIGGLRVSQLAAAGSGTTRITYTIC